MMIRSRSHLCRLSLVWLLLVGTGAGAAELTATLDRTQLALNETLRLTLRIDQRSPGEEPDFSALKPDFEILNTSRSTQLRIVNSRSESWSSWELLLAPRREGSLEIPAFELAGARSQPLSIKVGEAAPTDAGGQSDYYLELELDKEELYPQEQLLVRIRLLSAVSLGDLRGTALAIQGAQVIPLGDQEYQKVQGGTRYQVYQMDYAVFPQRSGSLMIPAQRFTAVKNPSRSLFDRGRGQPIRLATRQRAIEVRPLPAGQASNRWLPAASMELSEQLSDPGYRVGEPLTRTLTLTVEGQPATLLPPLLTGEIEGAKVYPEPPQNDTREHRDGVQGVRTQRLGVVPTRPGPLTLPAVELAWWDTTADRAAIARVPARVIEVLPAAGQTASPEPVAPAPPAPSVDTASVKVPAHPPSAPGVNWLLWSNLAWALLVAGLLLLWWLRLKGDSHPLRAASLGGAEVPDEAAAHRRLIEACGQGQAAEIREALLVWARWHLDEPVTLEGMAQRWPDSALQEALMQLDRALYRPGEGMVDGAKLLEAAGRIRDKSPSSSAGQAALPPLYRSL